MASVLFAAIATLSQSATALVPEPAVLRQARSSLALSLSTILSKSSHQQQQKKELKASNEPMYTTPSIITSGPRWHAGNYHAATKALIERINENGSVGVFHHSISEAALVNDALSRALEADPQNEKIAHALERSVWFTNRLVWRGDVNSFDLWTLDTAEPVPVPDNGPVDAFTVALRIRALTRYARVLRDSRNVSVAHLYAPHFPASTPIKHELEHLARMNRPASHSCRVMMKLALVDGALLARECGDPGAADYYLSCAELISTTGKEEEKHEDLVKNDKDGVVWQLERIMLTFDCVSMQEAGVLASILLAQTLAVDPPLADEWSVMAHALLAEYHLTTQTTTRVDLQSSEWTTDEAFNEVEGDYYEGEIEPHCLGPPPDLVTVSAIGPLAASMSRASWHMDQVIRSMLVRNKRMALLARTGAKIKSTTAVSEVRMWVAQVRAGLLLHHWEVE